MHLVFGMVADGRTYPEVPGTGSAVGSAVVGPAALLDLLATQLGLAGPEVPPVQRVAAWRAKLMRASACTHRFWSASLAVDSWSTSRHLLTWRDSLVEAGWVPCRSERHESLLRLRDIADAEHCEPDLPLGRADRLREIIGAFADGERVDVALVDLIDEEITLPAGWRHLMAALRSAGVLVRPLEIPPTIADETDLARVQRFLSDGCVEPLRGDGTVVEILSGTSLLGAECVAEWIACDPIRGRDTVIVTGGDTTLLDYAMTRRGLPALGLCAPSRLRGGFQALALCFAVAWKPLDVERLLEFLTLVPCPIAPWAADHLAAALREEPGTGGTAWRRAWTRIEVELRQGANACEPEKAAGLAEQWKSWLRAGYIERAVGMPTDLAAETCRRVAEWATLSDEVGGHLWARGVAEAARGMQAALAMLGQSFVMPNQLDQMLCQASEGLGDPTRHAEEGHIRAVDQPGSLWGPASRVVWWRFVQGPGRPATCPWNEAELAALAALGCRPESPVEAARREEAQWRSVVRHARQAILFVRPETEFGDEIARHPFAHRLDALFGTPAGQRAIRVAAEQLLTRRQVQVSDRTIARAASDLCTLPEARAVWELPRAVAERARGRRESATSLEDMMDCQFRWLLRHVAGLKSGRAKLPEGERLLGNVAHELARAVLDPGIIPDPVSVRTRARAEFDPLVERVAAPLLLPGRAAELAHARQRMPDALAALSGLLRSRAMAVEGTEVECVGDADGLRLFGRIDVVVHDSNGARGAVDLKWSRSASRRRVELAEGRAIQLATYGRLLGTAGHVAPSAFFLLRQRLSLSTSGSPLAGEEVAALRDLDGTWKAVVADWRALVDLAQRGIGLASGVGGDGHLAGDRALTGVRDVCASCDLKRLCRISTTRAAA